MTQDEFDKLLRSNPDIKIDMGNHTVPTTVASVPAAGPSEHEQQAALFAWAEQNMSCWPMLRWMFAIPNGGKRNMGTAVKLKREGAKAGVPDICLPYPVNGWHGLFVEMKVGSNKPTVGQRAYIDYLRGVGYCVRLCYSAKEAQKAIVEYLGG